MCNLLLLLLLLFPTNVQRVKADPSQINRDQHWLGLCLVGNKQRLSLPLSPSLFYKTKFAGRFNTVPYHARPLARTLVDNGIYRTMVPEAAAAGGLITVTYEPIIVEDDVSNNNNKNKNKKSQVARDFGGSQISFGRQCCH